MTPADDLTRRQALARAGLTAGALVFAPAVADGLLTASPALAASTAAAKATPELTEGPYWVNTLLHRSNVRANSNGTSHQAGVPLSLYINVSETGTRTPLNGLAVDIWHANAYGLYSDESSQQAGGGDSASTEDTIKDNFLRGYQLTGKDRGLAKTPVAGQVSFATIWPGWYTSRAIHIHVRVRELHSTGKTIAGYTTQIFFTDAANDAVFAGAAPYNTRSPKDDATTDENDTVLTKADFATNIVAVKGSIAKGFSATFNVAITPSQAKTTGSLSRPSSGGGGGGGTPPSGSGPGGAPPSA